MYRLWPSCNEKITQLPSRWEVSFLFCYSSDLYKPWTPESKSFKRFSYNGCLWFKPLEIMMCILNLILIFFPILCGNCPFNERIWLCDNTFVDWTTLQKLLSRRTIFFEACLPAHVRSKTEVNQRTEIEEWTTQFC